MTYGYARSILDMVEVIKREFPNVAIESIKRDDLMPVRGTLSIEKARRLLGYTPKNPIEAGVSRYIEWYRSLEPSVITANKV